MGTRTPKYAREQIERALRAERQVTRCAIAKKLTEAFHENHADLYARQDEISQEISKISAAETKLNIEKRELNSEASQIRTTISQLKSSEKVANTTPLEDRSRHSCSMSDLHPELAEFDMKTHALLGKLYIDETVDPKDFLES